MNKWLGPVYKKLAASELGAGHTSGIVPTRETQDYFGIADKNETHILKEIQIEFWYGEDMEEIKSNVMVYISNTHNGHIHITGNIFPAYMKFGAELGDIIVFWKSSTDENQFKAELIKPGSERWDLIDIEGDFPKNGGYLKLWPPPGDID